MVRRHISTIFDLECKHRIFDIFMDHMQVYKFNDSRWFGFYSIDADAETSVDKGFTFSVTFLHVIHRREFL